ncbi:MAG TPA: hypothetical protein VGG46_04890 [Terriglobales bacterium]
MPIESIESVHLYRDAVTTGVSLLLCLSALLLISSDVALLLDAMLTNNYDQRQQSSSRQLNWVVWIAGALLNVYYIWMSVNAIRLYKLESHRYMLIAVVAVAFLLLLFDIAVMIESFRPNADFVE